MKTHRIGVISDTHGLMRHEALDALAGSEMILHAGDIGSAEVIERLQEVAPVVAIRGNNDVEPWALRFPETTLVELEAARIFLIHSVRDLDFDPRATNFAAVVAGHSHKPFIETRDGVLYVNPGSAGPRRFKLPVCVARLTVRGKRVEAELVTLV